MKLLKHRKMRDTALLEVVPGVYKWVNMGYISPWLIGKTLTRQIDFDNNWAILEFDKNAKSKEIRDGFDEVFSNRRV